MSQDVNIQRTSGGSVTEVLPDQRREGEGMTEFTMRRLRNEVIEQCAHAAKNFDHRDIWSDDPDMNGIR